MYADDTSLLFRDEDSDNLPMHDFIEDSLNEVENWFTAHKLVMNAAKTLIIQFSASKAITDIENMVFAVNGGEIQLSESGKLLGLTIDNKLNWNAHIDVVCKKLASSIFALRQLKNVTTQEVLIPAYYAFFHSRITYGVIFWGNSSMTNVHRVLVLQKKAVRVIAGLGFNASCKEYFTELKILTIVAVYILNIVVFVKKYNHLINNVQPNHEHNTRNKDLSRTIKHDLTLYEKSVSYAGTKIYNRLPVHVRNLAIVEFKKYIKKYLINNPYYTFEDYVKDKKFEIM
jgi:hypothetical protein